MLTYAMKVKEFPEDWAKSHQPAPLQTADTDPSQVPTALKEARLTGHADSMRLDTECEKTRLACLEQPIVDRYFTGPADAQTGDVYFDEHSSLHVGHKTVKDKQGKETTVPVFGKLTKLPYAAEFGTEPG